MDRTKELLLSLAAPPSHQCYLCEEEEVLGEDGTFGRRSYKEILLVRYFREALRRLNPWITEAQIGEAQRAMEHLTAHAG